MSDRTTIYCVKTGQPVGTMFGTYQYHPSAVASDWFQTDGQYLDGLQGQKPRAYVAFCLGIVDQFWRANAHKSRIRQEAQEHHWALVRAYELLETVPETQLMELSDALCRFLTYAPLSYRALDAMQKGNKDYRTADGLAEKALHGVLLGVLAKSTVRTLAIAEGYHKAGASVKTPKFEILPASIKDAAKGPSNIRDQKTSKNYQLNAKQNKLMADIMKLAGFAEFFGRAAPQVNQAAGLMARVAKNASKLDQNIVSGVSLDNEQLDTLAELEKIMGEMPSDMWSDDLDNDEDDNEVIVRRIPRQLVESMNEPEGLLQPLGSVVIPEQTIIPTTPQLPVRMSLAERAKRNSEVK